MSRLDMIREAWKLVRAEYTDKGIDPESVPIETLERQVDHLLRINARPKMSKEAKDKLRLAQSRDAFNRRAVEKAKDMRFDRDARFLPVSSQELSRPPRVKDTSKAAAKRIRRRLRSDSETCRLAIGLIDEQLSRDKSLRTRQRKDLLEKRRLLGNQVLTEEQVQLATTKLVKKPNALVVAARLDTKGLKRGAVLDNVVVEHALSAKQRRK